MGAVSPSGPSQSGMEDTKRLIRMCGDEESAKYRLGMEEVTPRVPSQNIDIVYSVFIVCPRNVD